MKMKQKTKKRIQWLTIIGAVAVAVQQLASNGVIPPDIAISVLDITNLISAILPEINKKIEDGE